MNQDKIKELAKFVQTYEGKDEFEQKSIVMYGNDFDFLIEILEKKSSDMPAMASEYAMRVLGVLVKNIEKDERSNHSTDYSITKIDKLGDIAKALEKSGEQCNDSNFVEMVIDNGCTYYSGTQWPHLHVFHYLMSIQLSEEQISRMIRSRGYTSGYLSLHAVNLFCSRLEYINNTDLNFILGKLLDSHSSCETQMSLVREEKTWRRKRKNIETPTKEVKDEPG